ncbi:MAG TPA: UDP-N-acetylmuramoyl-L-alanyl-D-glutamate--2,6-diaminopimelate ligase [Candidatus Binataceae bacterium]|nr:UDP-N-acetylmuramoyl-L-alanyl-D-glutamate--2,6-diaminopimelate ligase [Candidatus Binataceae bacterium]
MKLSALIAGGESRWVAGDRDPEIRGLAYDSRRVTAGELFFATTREPAAAQAYAEEALNRGARAVVVRDWAGGGARSAATIIECAHPRQLMGVAASRFFGAPSRSLDLIGVTGTSGKTTTTYLLKAIFEAAGLSAGILGTIGIFIGAQKLYSGLTTPESIDFESALATMRDQGTRAAAAEISSIGLAEGRVEELSFRAALFTNLGRDHLDYHHNAENYFAAKLRLFSEILPRSRHPDPIAVVNGDDPCGAAVIDATPTAKLSFGLGAERDVRALDAKFGADGIHATIEACGRRFVIASPMLGEINLRNILGASAVSVALGIEVAAVAEGVRRCPGAPGRLEAVGGPPGVKVLVDYAHKPDALAAVLATLRALGPRRLVCVFGCGGDRDRGKRPLMGAIAGRLADLVILTSDNPRSEAPGRIMAEIETGLAATALKRIDEAAARNGAGYIFEPERREAIAIALRLARPRDTVVIAGKGHEDYQLVGDKRLDFDDRAVVRELIAARP